MSAAGTWYRAASGDMGAEIEPCIPILQKKHNLTANYGMSVMSFGHFSLYLEVSFLRGAEVSFPKGAEMAGAAVVGAEASKPRPLFK